MGPCPLRAVRPRYRVTRTGMLPVRPHGDPFGAYNAGCRNGEWEQQ